MQLTPLSAEWCPLVEVVLPKALHELCTEHARRQGDTAADAGGDLEEEQSKVGLSEKECAALGLYLAGDPTFRKQIGDLLSGLGMCI